jgi:hypothetical protein
MHRSRSLITCYKNNMKEEILFVIVALVATIAVTLFIGELSGTTDAFINSFN